MRELTKEEKERIQKAIKDLKDPNSEDSKRFEATKKKIRKDLKLQELKKAIYESERITAEDLKVVIDI
ncbi:MAG TPA: hypothetical protein VGA67_01610 [Candidatus Dojkabacteria bacterium]